MCRTIIFGSYFRLSIINPYICFATKSHDILRCEGRTSDSKQVCSVTMEHFQFDFHFPLNACTRHRHPSFTHFTSYSLLPDFTTLNSRFNEIAQSHSIFYGFNVWICCTLHYLIPSVLPLRISYVFCDMTAKTMLFPFFWQLVLLVIR